MSTTDRIFCAKDFRAELGKKTLVMGILNVTPDSFSDGGESFQIESAVSNALMLEKDGADIIDIGGESTRPGSDPVSTEEELRRVIPAIKALSKRLKIPISVDTYKSEVAEEAIRSGAKIVNDISGGSFDPLMPKLVLDTGVGVILMHIKGEPKNMQQNPHYDDVIVEVGSFLREAVAKFTSIGVAKTNIMVDPGIGFGKNFEHNLSLMKSANSFYDLAAGVMMGSSRKSFLGKITGNEVDNRISESISAAVISVMYGADGVRVHDVREVVAAVKVADKFREVGTFNRVEK
jgi:dihydropteroate synthase